MKDLKLHKHIEWLPCFDWPTKCSLCACSESSLIKNANKHIKKENIHSGKKSNEME